MFFVTKQCIGKSVANLRGMTALEDTWRIFVSLGNNAQLFFLSIITKVICTDFKYFSIFIGTYTLLIPLDGWMDTNTLKKLFKFVL